MAPREFYVSGEETLFVENTQRIVIADPHFHLWQLDRIHYPWLTDEPLIPLVAAHSEFQRDYSLDDYLNDAVEFDLRRAVHVEALPAPQEAISETAWLQSLADQPGSRGMPQGIVAAVDLSAENALETLAGHCRYPNVRGVRQVLSWLPAQTMSNSLWRSRYAALADYRLSFDMAIAPPQMAEAAALARDFPHIPVALNHNGLLMLHRGDPLDDWREGMRQLAGCDNVVAKLSGFGPYAPGWNAAGIRSIVRETIDLFGTERCMFASNYPVDRPFCGFTAMWRAYWQIAQEFGEDAAMRLLHDNAIKFYRL